MEVTGRLIEIFDVQQVSDKFKKRDFVLEYIENPQYPEFINFQAIQDKTDMLDPYKINDEVTVSFNLKGRAWQSPQGETKYFNTLQAWRIAKATGQVPQVAAPIQNDGGDDLPF